jgi:hypothetical protein
MASLYALILTGELAHFVVPFLHNPSDALWSDPGRWWQYGGSGIDKSPLALSGWALWHSWRAGEGAAAGLLGALLLTWLVVQGLMLLTVNEGRYRKPAEGLILSALLLAVPRRGPG